MGKGFHMNCIAIYLMNKYNYTGINSFGGNRISVILSGGGVSVVPQRLSLSFPEGKRCGNVCVWGVEYEL